MFTTREGFTIDAVAATVRTWLLNPAATVPLAIGLSYQPIFSRLLQHITTAQATTIQSRARWLALASLLLACNDQLNKRIANNWTTDPTWDWDKEIVVVTGGSSGIGASICQRLIRGNPRTLIIVVDYAPLKWTPPSNGRFDYFQCDLSDSSAIKETCERIRKKHGDPTVLFNNAGLCRGMTIMEGSYEDVEVTIKTNLTAPILLAKEFLPAMVRHNHGHIVNTGSMSSLVPPVRIGDYAATKAGLTALHEVLQLELKDVHNAPKVRLTLGIFSFISTPLFDGKTNQSNFLSPLLNVESVSEAMVDAVYSGYGRTIYMPWIMRYIAIAKGGPEWYFKLMRESTSRIRLNFTGRQELTEKGGLRQKEE